MKSRRRTLIGSRLVAICLGLGLCGGLSACSKTSYQKWGTTGSTASQSQTASSSQASPSFASKQVQAVNQPLNQSDQYALTSSDVQTLDQNGVLAQGDKPALNTMVKQ